MKISNQSSDYLYRLARILRTDKERLGRLERGLERISGKKGVLEKIVSQNDQLVKEKLFLLGVRRDAYAHEVYDALISKIEADDFKIFEHLKLKNLRGQAAAQRVVDFITLIHPTFSGYFLKKEKAKEFLINEPPRNIMKTLGYTDVKEMVEKENLEEVYSALRFLEERDWLNKTFFKQYESLTPFDFEERLIEVRALPDKWAKMAEQFVAKKYHNVSHLKELGVIFVIPIFLGISGETLRLLALLLHYMHEVKYYSEIFRSFKKEDASFAKNIISTLRGDVLKERLPVDVRQSHPVFLVVQRYLAKDDKNDWRLFEPRVNPEAMHWERAERDLQKIDEIVDLKDGLEFWRDTNWVGDYFMSDSGVDVLVSFNLVDTVMSLVKKREMIKYLYHHQEALWNKIFIEYFGEKKLEQMTKDYILKGWFEMQA